MYAYIYIYVYDYAYIYIYVYGYAYIYIYLYNDVNFSTFKYMHMPAATCIPAYNMSMSTYMSIPMSPTTTMPSCI